MHENRFYLGRRRREVNKKKQEMTVYKTKSPQNILNKNGVHIALLDHLVAKATTDQINGFCSFDLKF